MQTIETGITIQAPAQKVWNTMLQPDTYREWTKAFHPTSRYEGSWEKGSEIRFLGTSEDGKTEGMYSRIKENIPHRFVSIEHLGIIANGEPDTTSEQAKKWAPTFENYTFTEDGNSTHLKLEMQVDAEYVPMFEKMWADALERLKRMCETA